MVILQDIVKQKDPQATGCGTKIMWKDWKKKRKHWIYIHQVRQHLREKNSELSRSNALCKHKTKRWRNSAVRQHLWRELTDDVLGQELSLDCSLLECFCNFNYFSLHRCFCFEFPETRVFFINWRKNICIQALPFDKFLLHCPVQLH